MEAGRQPPSLVSLLGVDTRLGVRQREELYAMWSAARAEANLAYESWQARPGCERYWAYRAAEERADAAQDALARAYSGSGGFSAAA